LLGKRRKQTEKGKPIEKSKNEEQKKPQTKNQRRVERKNSSKSKAIAHLTRGDDDIVEEEDDELSDDEDYEEDDEDYGTKSYMVKFKADDQDVKDNRTLCSCLQLTNNPLLKLYTACVGGSICTNPAMLTNPRKNSRHHWA
jgi:hypothetical protein